MTQVADFGRPHGIHGDAADLRLEPVGQVPFRNGRQHVREGYRVLRGQRFRGCRYARQRPRHGQPQDQECHAPSDRDPQAQNHRHGPYAGNSGHGGDGPEGNADQAEAKPGVDRLANQSGNEP